jgi:hypothetical protein
MGHAPSVNQVGAVGLFLVAGGWVQYRESDRLYASAGTNQPSNQPHQLTIPPPPPKKPQCDGEWRYDPRSTALIWSVDIIDDTNRSGSLEFVVPACDPGVFYPIEVSFSAAKTLCDIEIESITNLTNGEIVRYGSSRVLSTAGYQVV